MVLVIAIADRNQRRRAGTQEPARETRGHRRPSAPTADVSLPSGVCPYGESPYSSRANARSATTPGMSRSWIRRFSRSWRTRTKSSSASVGRAATLGEQLEALSGEPAERRQADERRVGADVGVELRADAGDLLVHLDGGPRARALVEHVGGDRRQAFLAGRIVGGAAPDDQEEPDQRHAVVAHAPHPQAVREHGLVDGGKRERAGRLGQPAAGSGPRR